MGKLLSVIIPAFNEEAMILKTISVISKILEDAEIPYELIFVDDGSKDETWSLICQASAHSTKIKGVSFSRNFGKDPAIFAGLEYAKGDACVVIDCDLQHPPEKIVEMYRMWEDGYRVVEGKKISRGKENIIHTFCSNTFYKLINRASKMDMNNASDFKLLDRKAVNALLTIKEQKPFFRALSSWVGFKTGTVEFEVRERVAGESRWSVKSLISYAITNITSFSTTPMQISTAFGGISLLLAVAAIVLYAVFGADASFWLPTLVIALFVLGGFTLISMGLIAYYIGKIYRQSLRRPIYIVGDTCGGVEQWIK